jgi:hypothetical protein
LKLKFRDGQMTNDLSNTFSNPESFTDGAEC